MTRLSVHHHRLRRSLRWPQRCQKRASRSQARPRLEVLERRELLAAELLSLTSTPFAEGELAGQVADETVVVTTATDEDNGTTDPGQGTGTSLREAISFANASSGSVAIRFDESLNGVPIVLNITGTDEDDNATGDLDILGDIHVIGNGDLNTVIDAGGANGLGDRVFHVDLVGKLTLCDIRVTGGNDTFDEFAINTAGGILNSGELTVVRSVITGNIASGSAFEAAGGILNSEGKLTITDSMITLNTVATADFEAGGGIFSSIGDLTIEGTTISDNEASGDDTAAGIYISSGTVAIVDSTLQHNIGDAIRQGFDSSSLTIENSTIHRNNGNGLYLTSGNTTVVSSTLSENQSHAVFQDFGSSAAVFLTSSTISGNDGSAIRNESGSFTINSSTIVGNGAPAIFYEGTGVVNNTIITSSDSGDDFEAGLGGEGSLTGSTNLVDETSFPGRLSPVTGLDSVLADNGGSTLTHALLDGSNAIDSGDGSLLPADVLDADGDDDLTESHPLDQVGNARIADQPDVGNTHDGLDIGAFELALIEPLDFGDAPTAADSGFPNDYPVTRAHDGARHSMTSLFLGSSVDIEDEGQPDDLAGQDAVGGDDNLGNDDEDGVQEIASILAVSGTDTGSSFRVVASDAGKLDAWIDFNRDGSWGTSERIADSIDVVAGVNVLAFTIPDDASTGLTFARFRVSTAGNLEPTGAADDGEVEDLAASIFNGSFSPNATVNLIDTDSSVTVMDGNIIVGSNQNDLFRVPIANIGQLQLNGTDSDDVLTLDGTGGSVTPAGGLSIDGGSGKNTLRLTGGQSDLDFTNDGNAVARNLGSIDLTDVTVQQITVDAASVASLTSTNSLVVVGGDDDRVLFDDADDWRMDATSVVDGRFVRSVTNVAGGAETFDTELPHAWQNVIKFGDVNNSGDVTSNDALIIINELGSNVYSVPVTGELADPLLVEIWPGMYFDQNGDDKATGLDALIIINSLGIVDSSGELIEGELIEGESIALIAPLVRMNSVADADDATVDEVIEVLTASSRAVGVTESRSSQSNDVALIETVNANDTDRETELERVADLLFDALEIG